MDNKSLIKALRCSEAPDEPDGLGCANKCKYRDVDGACNIVSMCLDAASKIERLTSENKSLQSKYDELQRYNVDCTKKCDELNVQNAELKRELSMAVELAGKYVALCNPPRESYDRLFRRHINRPGDYMGCGYDFLDAANGIFDEFEETATENVGRAIRTVVEQTLEQWYRNGDKDDG